MARLTPAQQRALNLLRLRAFEPLKSRGPQHDGPRYTSGDDVIGATSAAALVRQRLARTATRDHAVVLEITPAGERLLRELQGEPPPDVDEAAVTMVAELLARMGRLAQRLYVEELDAQGDDSDAQELRELVTLGRVGADVLREQARRLLQGEARS